MLKWHCQAKESIPLPAGNAEQLLQEDERHKQSTSKVLKRGIPEMGGGKGRGAIITIAITPTHEYYYHFANECIQSSSHNTSNLMYPHSNQKKSYCRRYNEKTTTDYCLGKQGLYLFRVRTL